MNSRKPGWIILEVIVVTQIAAAAAAAQTSNTGPLIGWVYEKSSNPAAGKKTPIKDAIVWVVRDDGFNRDTTTNKDGQYEIPALPPAEYILHAKCGPHMQCDTYSTPKPMRVRAAMKNIVSPTIIYLTVKRDVKEQERRPVALPNVVASTFPVSFVRRSGSFVTSLTPAGSAAGAAPQASGPGSVIPASQLINTINGTREGSVDAETSTALPLGGIRTVESLGFLFPGVAPPPQTLSQTAGPGIGSSVGTSGQFSINGLRSRANNFTIDGSDNNDEDIGVRRQGFTALLPQSVESVQEYHITTLLAPPQFGRNLGAQVDIVSRRGAPRFHGAAYAFYTEDRLKARDFFDRTGVPLPVPVRREDDVDVIFNGQPLSLVNPVEGEDRFDRTQFGFVFGGPLGKPAPRNAGTGLVPSKPPTLFFLSAERQVVNAGKESHFAVPTVAERGLFGSGDKGLCAASTGEIRVRKECPNGEFPIYPTSATGNGVFSFFPFPNDERGPYGKNTFTQVLPADARGTVASLRLDRAFNGGRPSARSQALAARFNFTDDDTVLPVTGGALFSSVRSRVQTRNLALFYNSVLATNAVNELRGSYGRTRLDFREAPNPLRQESIGACDRRLPHCLLASRLEREEFLLNTQLIVNGTRPGVGCDTLPKKGQPCFSSDRAIDTERDGFLGHIGQVSVSGFSPIGVDVFNFPQQRANHTIQLADTLFYQRRAHRFTAGFDLRRTQLNSRLDRNFRPLIVFNGAPDLVNPKPDRTGFYLGSDFAAAGAPTGFFQTLAVPDPNTGQLPDPILRLKYWQTDFFLADEIRPRPNLSLTFGARYQFTSAPRDVSGRTEAAFRSSVTWDFIQEEINLFGKGNSGLARFLAGRTAIFKADRNNLAPQITFAWGPLSDGSMAIRGGYGLYYDQIPGAVTNQSRNVFPNFLTLNLAGLIRSPNTTTLSDFFALNPSSIYAIPGTLNVYNSEENGADLIAFLRFLNRRSAPDLGLEPRVFPGFPGGPGFVLPAADIPTSYAQHWGLTVEKEWRTDFLASLAYVGTRGVHLLRFATPNLGLNTIPVVRQARRVGFAPVFQGYTLAPKFESRHKRPFPLLGSFTSIEADANSIYHSLQAELNKRLRSGLQFTTAYTWSHAIDEVSDLFDLAGGPVLPQNSLDRGAERASAGFDIRHSFVYSLMWDLPSPKRNKLFARWRLASIGTFRTGQPFTLLACCDVNLDGNLSDRINRADGILQEGQGPVRFSLQEDPFSLMASPGQNGKLRRNTFRAPGVATIDLAVSRKFSITERQRLDLRVEFFNLLNRAHFGVPVHQLLFPGLGRSVDTRLPALTVQFALKYSF